MRTYENFPSSHSTNLNRFQIHFKFSNDKNGVYI